MENYRALPKVRDPIKEDEIRITSKGRVFNYLNYALRLFDEQKRTSLTIKATGNAISRAIALAETIKRRFTGLHQITRCGSTTITDVFEPIEEGLKEVRNERATSFVELILSKEPLDVNDPGYQPPLDPSLVTEFTEEELMLFRQKGYYKSIGRGRFPSNRGAQGYRSMRNPRGSRQPETDEYQDTEELPNGSEGKPFKNGTIPNKGWYDGPRNQAPPYRGNSNGWRGGRGYRGSLRGQGRGRGGRFDRADRIEVRDLSLPYKQSEVFIT